MSVVVEGYFHRLRNGTMESKALFEMRFTNIHSLGVTGWGVLG
jgi:hypothetical protein